MAGIDSKHMDSPDEVRTPDKTRVEVVHVGGTEVGRFTFQPGWKWSECISGAMHIEHDDGTKVDIKPGSAYLIAPGHDGWVVGNEPAVGIEFRSAATYAKG